MKRITTSVIEETNDTIKQHLIQLILSSIPKDIELTNSLKEEYKMVENMIFNLVSCSELNKNIGPSVLYNG